MTDNRKYHDPTILQWKGLELRLKTGRLLATVEPDSKYPGMYRVRMKGGQLSGMVNLSRAKDAARSLAMASLNQDTRQTAIEASPMRPISEAGE
jgi:hypothetical protein